MPRAAPLCHSWGHICVPALGTHLCHIWGHICVTPGGISVSQLGAHLCHSPGDTSVSQLGAHLCGSPGDTSVCQPWGHICATAGGTSVCQPSDTSVSSLGGCTESLCPSPASGLPALQFFPENLLPELWQHGMVCVTLSKFAFLRAPSILSSISKISFLKYLFDSATCSLLLVLLPREQQKALAEHPCSSGFGAAQQSSPGAVPLPVCSQNLWQHWLGLSGPTGSADSSQPTLQPWLSPAKLLNLSSSL